MPPSRSVDGKAPQAEELLEVATRAAQRAGELLLERFHAPARGLATKSTPTDLVSDADRDSEELMLDIVRSERPDDGILSEERGGKEARSGLTWVIDPLDGTVNFLFHIPVWCVSVAVEDGDGAVIGVVHDPNRSETFTAIRGDGTRLNGSRVHVSGERDLAKAMIGTGFAYDARARAVQADVLTRVLPRVRDIRRAGSAALDLAWLAAGRFDGFYEAPMEKWDKAAGVLLVEEAGGVVTDLPAPLGLSTGVIASGPSLHGALTGLVHAGSQGEM